MRRLFGASLIAASLALAGCTGGGGGDGAGGGTTGGHDKIPIGYYGDLSGKTSTFGTSTKEGIDLAVEGINQKPPLGREFDIHPDDDQGRPEMANTVVNKLLTKDNVAAVLGEVASSNSLAAAPLCQRQKVPMITPASTNVKVTKVGDYIFRICFIDPFQGYVMAKFAVDNLKAKKAAILKDVSSDYSQGLANAFKDTFTKLGGQIVREASYQQGDTDFNGQLSAIKAAGPDIIFIPGYYTEVGTIGRQARDQGITPPLLGGDGWDSPKLFEGAGDKLEGCYFSNHYSAENQDPRVQDFVKAYKAKYNGKVPDAMAALAYDATRILADAIQRAGSVDGDKVRDAIAKTANFPGVTGNITIDQDRNARKPAVVLQIKGTGYKYVTTINP